MTHLCPVRLLKNHLPFLTALLLFSAAIIVTYPYYKYYIDPDAVAYLSIAQRYASGEWLLAINGLWSPLSPFITSVFMRLGMNVLPAAHLCNAVAGAGVLLGLNLFFQRFRMTRFQLWVTLPVLAIALVYFHYLQLFADLWMICFLLFYFLLTLRRDFPLRAAFWPLAALLTALAFYAKAYAFYFVLLHLSVVLFLLWRKQMSTGRQALTAWLVTVILTISFVAPWGFALKHKYGDWSLSHAGTLNKTWFLTGQKQYRADIQLLVPPPYPGSVSEWEDPWVSRGTPHHSFESPQTIKRQTLLSGRAVLQLIAACNELSPFLLAIWLLTTFAFLSRRCAFTLKTEEQLLLLTAFLFPLGYLTLFVETRYVWLLAPFILVFGMRWLGVSRGRLPRQGYRLAALLLSGSFLLTPVSGMTELYGKQRDVWEQAAALKEKNFAGSFTSNNPSLVREWVLAWLTDNPNYLIYPRPYEPEELIREMKRYGVRYFLNYTYTPGTLPGLQLTDSLPGVFIYELE